MTHGKYFRSFIRSRDWILEIFQSRESNRDCLCKSTESNQGLHTHDMTPGPVNLLVAVWIGFIEKTEGILISIVCQVCFKRAKSDLDPNGIADLSLFGNLQNRLAMYSTFLGCTDMFCSVMIV